MNDTGPFSGRGDPLYNDAIKVVRETGRGSISTVQRVLRIGYNRAAYLIEAMESDGIVSAPSYDGKRKVLPPATEGGDGR